MANIKDVHVFIDENDSISKAGILKQLKNCAKNQIIMNMRNKSRSLKVYVKSIKQKPSDIYKHEYNVMVKNVEINNDTVESLEAQIVDLKKIVSRLTRNNRELLGIVSEKISYEDLITDLKKRNLTPPSLRIGCSQLSLKLLA